MDEYNYRTHVEEDLAGDMIPLDEVDFDQMRNNYTKLIEKAKAKGLEQCVIYFESSYEPHEDYLGNPYMGVRGVRPKTQEELKAQEIEDAIKKYAESKGISIYHARQAYELYNA